VLAVLKPAGRLVVVDYMPLRTRDRPRADQTKNHVIAPELVEEELRDFGFQILERRDWFIAYPDDERAFWLIVAQRP
jgi:predicted methyltransferase